jgi:purine-nucleoside phosphorylase
MSLMHDLEEAVRFIGNATELRPHIGLVLGSGLGAFAKSLSGVTRLPYGRIPHFPAATAAGHKGEAVLGWSQGVPVAVLSGRTHYYEGYALERVVFPIRALGRLGVKTLILTNAAGAVNVSFKPGDLMIIEDHINHMGGSPLVGPNEDELGPRFPDMSEAYDLALRAIAEKACRKAGVQARKGVYLAVSGPSYETPAEFRMARAIGADAIGMSTVPETIAARHMDLRVLGLSCITNKAADILKKKLDHREVLEVGERFQSSFVEVLTLIVRDCLNGAA